jgi:hypothetical protein
MTSFYALFNLMAAAMLFGACMGAFLTSLFYKTAIARLERHNDMLRDELHISWRRP